MIRLLVPGYSSGTLCPHTKFRWDIPRRADSPAQLPVVKTFPTFGQRKGWFSGSEWLEWALWIEWLSERLRHLRRVQGYPHRYMANFRFYLNQSTRSPLRSQESKQNEMQATQVFWYLHFSKYADTASEESSSRHRDCHDLDSPGGTPTPQKKNQPWAEEWESKLHHTALHSGKGGHVLEAGLPVTLSPLESLSLPLPFMVSLESRLQTAWIASNSINSIVWDEKRAILLARVEH